MSWYVGTWVGNCVGRGGAVPLWQCVGHAQVRQVVEGEVNASVTCGGKVWAAVFEPAWCVVWRVLAQIVRRCV